VKPLAVFDLDGTLVDSRQDIVASANDMLASFGAAPLREDSIAGFVGDGARMLVARSLKAAGVPTGDLGIALERFLEIYNGRLLETTKPYDGIAALIDDAVDLGVLLGVITNKPEVPSLKILDAFQLSMSFGWVIGGDDPRFARKPDPASLRWLIAHAGADPARTLYIGDSEIDAATARAAGTRFCLAAYGFGQARGTVELRPGEFSAQSAPEVLPVIQDLFS
jgi:phosphoglycolate phosphatase